MFLDLDRLRPTVFDSVAKAMQRSDTRIPSPGKDDLLDAPRPDKLIVNLVGRHADHREVALRLADNLMPGGEGDQVREAFKGDRVAIANRLADRF
jgi:hypothetical protein